MKKSILTVSAFFVAISLSAFDFGGSLGNISKFEDTFSNDGLKLNQKNYASVWGQVPFQDTKNYFFVQGRFQHEYDADKKDSINALNLDTAQFVFYKQNFLFKVGRFYYSDISSIIYNQSGDGAEVQFQLPGIKASAYGFYTGLLNSQFVTLNDFDYIADEDKIYDLCAKYLIAGLKVELPSFLGEQTLSAEILNACRLEGKNYNRLFAEGKLEGPISVLNGLFYDLTAAVEFSKYDDQKFKIANLSKARIYFYPGVKDTQLSFNAVYTTGEEKDKDSSVNAFSAITSSTAVNSIEEPEFSGIFKTGLSASIKPVKNLLVAANADAVFNTNKNKNKYSGFQYKALANWQILSDFFAGAELSQFFDKDNSDNNKTSISLKAILTF